MIKETKVLKTLYKELYSVLPSDFEQRIYPFFVQVGKKYYETEKQCLFIGKSENGWVTDSRNVDELFDIKNENRIVNRHDQMEWVNKLEGPNEVYNTKKSAFWRVVKGISKAVCNKDDWYNHIAWSNLYKLSPESGNPSSWLQGIQRDNCVKILNEEINILKPKYVIFLTSNWEQFYIESFGIDVKKTKKIKWTGYETHYRNYDGKLFVQSRHPQGKDENTHIEAITKIVKDS